MKHNSVRGGTGEGISAYDISNKFNPRNEKVNRGDNDKINSSSNI